MQTATPGVAIAMSDTDHDNETDGGARITRSPQADIKEHEQGWEGSDTLQVESHPVEGE